MNKTKKTSLFFLKFVFLAGLTFSWLFDMPPIISFLSLKTKGSILSAAPVTNTTTETLFLETPPTTEEPLGIDDAVLRADTNITTQIEEINLLKGVEEKETDLEKNKEEEKSFAEKSFGDIWVAIVSQNPKSELWISDFEKENWQKIIEVEWETIFENTPIGFQEGVILWLSFDKKAVVGFNTLSQVIFSQTIEPLGNTIIELDSRKYVLLVQNDNILLTPQLNEAVIAE